MQTVYWLFHHHFQKSNISFQRKPCSSHYWIPSFAIWFFNLQNQVVKYPEFEIHEKSSHWKILVFVPKLWCFPSIFFDHDYWMVRLYGPKVKETPFDWSFLLLVIEFSWEPLFFCSFLLMCFSKAFLINLLTFDKHQFFSYFHYNVQQKTFKVNFFIDDIKILGMSLHFPIFYFHSNPRASQRICT